MTVNEFSYPTNERIGEIKVVGYGFDKDREFYTLKLEKKITKGNVYRVAMNFVSELNDELKGFYRSTYKNDNGDEE